MTYSVPDICDEFIEEITVLEPLFANYGAKLRFSGEIVKALKVNVDKTGDRTTLSLRPERVTLNPSTESLENIFEGTVRELIYLGDHLRTRINVCGNDDFIVKVPNSAGRLKISKGEKVNVGWTFEDCRALDYLP